MNIEEKAFVELTYTLRTDSPEGPIVEQVSKDTPLRFVYGAGQMLEMFENKIAGLKPGDTFSFTLKPEEAYGEREEAAIVDLPKSIFVIDGQLRDDLIQLGSHVPMMSDEGQRMVGIVLEVTQDTVKMDFNHPMAGETLCFSGEVLNVREATEDELNPRGCSGGCGHCGGGCGGGESSCSDGGCCGEGGCNGGK
ncbi:MAG: FKBP-type peptidyl-prolyl cis-trans isomerase [Marinilabiliaceae bacterium]|nr:FKBP-type peptidyl-prolyl cis-trans isomerase [Marinilabiliaceae bacterium]